MFLYHVQARPIIPNASLDKATKFKKLLQNILSSFGRPNTEWLVIKTNKTSKDKNGNTKTEYIQNPNRYLIPLHFMHC